MKKLYLLLILVWSPSVCAMDQFAAWATPIKKAFTWAFYTEGTPRSPICTEMHEMKHESPEKQNSVDEEEPQGSDTTELLKKWHSLWQEDNQLEAIKDFVAEHKEEFANLSDLVDSLSDEGMTLLYALVKYDKVRSEKTWLYNLFVYDLKASTDIIPELQPSLKELFAKSKARSERVKRSLFTKKGSKSPKSPSDTSSSSKKTSPKQKKPDKQMSPLKQRRRSSDKPRRSRFARATRYRASTTGTAPTFKASVESSTLTESPKKEAGLSRQKLAVVALCATFVGLLYKYSNKSALGGQNPSAIAVAA